MADAITFSRKVAVRRRTARRVIRSGLRRSIRSAWNFCLSVFLSEERGEWPDIDLDLPSGDQRERAIQYVYGPYGKLGAAMTANVITYRGRSAAREVGKVLGFDEETVRRLSSLVHTWELKDPKDTTERQFKDAGLDLADRRIKKFFQLYTAVQDLPRHLGQHSSPVSFQSSVVS
jgi:error-prone DNA polymerase